ncbi:transporter substrate-binding domain-containing protein [Caballeronia sordidicola]|uniref:Extracellular solute-binding protein, family 3 n=1 Tax=Caballeronia sordidicola TaxID=196367 RepID=A0A226X0X4_CABSO|nr:transporter substrate-binding domain-containing protein [Caballeronia sordidicola]OXC76779.1 extracellular solute-binding protein, family 3 [Caballeronia sordidicola]
MATLSILISRFVVFAGIAATSAVAHADALQSIRERGSLIAAIDVSYPPFGKLDAAAIESGSDVETARLLAKDMGVKLKIVPVSGAARVPFLLSNKVDVVIASFSITEERKKVVDYSLPYAVDYLVVAAPKSTAVSQISDLAGKSIAVTRGTTADIELTGALQKKGITANVVRYEDEATTNTAVITGQQDIFAASLSTVQSLEERSPEKSIAIKFNLANYPLAIGIRKNEPALKAWIDAWVKAGMKNGKLNKIFVTYFGQSLPTDLAN